MYNETENLAGSKASAAECAPTDYFARAPKTVVVDNYDSFTYNLVQMLSTICPDKIKVVRNDEISFSALALMKPDKIVLSPGPGHPGSTRDFGLCQEILSRQGELGASILGVCLGHQGMAATCGATIEKLAVPVHGKTSRINVLAQSKLFEGLGDEFEAMRYHSLYVSDKGLPRSLKVTARSADNVIMALEHQEMPIYGIQFHPESIATPQGKKILENFIRSC